MSKHTPGPWIFENRDGDHPLNDQDGWGCDGLWAVNGGFILGSGTGWDGAYQGPIEANAQLIAAAPEMLELMKQVADLQNPRFNDAAYMDLVTEMDRLADLAQELMAKIEGGGDE